MIENAALSLQFAPEQISANDTLKLPEPEENDIISFQKEMGNDHYICSDSITEAQKAAEGAGKSPTMGDAILEGIDSMRTKMKSNYDSMINDINKLGEQPSIPEAIKLQYKVMSHGIFVSAASKFGERTSKDVQVLFKAQG